MWEQTKKNGVFMCERVTDKATGKTRILSVKVKSLTRTGRKEAREKLREKIENEQPKRMKLSKLIEIYNIDHRRNVREQTAITAESTLTSALEVVGDIYIDTMTAGYIRSKLAESGKENMTLNNYLRWIKTMLKWAYKNDYVGREVADKLTLFKEEQTYKERIQDKYLEKSELKALLDSMDMEHWKLLTEFLALSGLRIGEAVALNESDIDGKYIHVRETFSRPIHDLSPAKTASSVRDVYIQPELADCIKRIHTCMLRQKMMYGYAETEYLFTSINGLRISYDPYYKYLVKMASVTVPDKKVSPHTLRHTMTSLFAEAGVDLDTIGRRLGHGENSAITRQIYLHVTEKMRERDNEKIKGVNLFA